MDDTEMREQICAVLQSLNSTTEESIRRELASRFELGHSGRLQFEIDPFSAGIHLVQTEETVVPGNAVWDALPKALPEETEAAGLDIATAINEELVSWFAKRWQAVGGPQSYHPAYAFFHGRDERRYDLEAQRWMDVSEVWPKKNWSSQEGAGKEQ